MPNYSIDTPAPYINDGSYREIARATIYDPIPLKVSIYDKVVYLNASGRISHSAIVEKIDPPAFKSYYIDSGCVVSRTPDGFENRTRPFGNNLVYYRPANASIATGLPSKRIALWSPLTGQYVCADLLYGRNAPLYSNRTDPQEWETFDLVDIGGGKSALWAYATGKFVCATDYPAKRSTADYPDYSNSWTKFTVEKSSPYVYLKCRNAYYLHSRSFNAECPGKTYEARFILVNLN